MTILGSTPRHINGESVFSWSMAASGAQGPGTSGPDWCPTWLSRAQVGSKSRSTWPRPGRDSAKSGPNQFSFSSPAVLPSFPCASPNPPPIPTSSPPVPPQFPSVLLRFFPVPLIPFSSPSAPPPVLPNSLCFPPIPFQSPQVLHQFTPVPFSSSSALPQFPPSP